jgi:hypothetical protein
MAYTDPPTFEAGDPLAAAELNVLSDDIAAIYSSVQGTTFSGVQVTRDADQSIGNASDTLVSWDTENMDVGGWYTSGTKIIIPAGAVPAGASTIGILCIASAKFAANGTGYRLIRILKDGSSIGYWRVSALSGEATDLQIVEPSVAAAAAEYQVQVYQNSGGSLNMAEARLTIIRLGVAS